MREAIEKLKRTYNFGSTVTLSEQQFFAILGLFNRSVKGSRSALESENCIIRADIPGIGAVVVKHYRRGGLLRHIIAASYFRCGPPRSQREYEILSLAKDIGISVPSVVAYASKGILFYRAWLVTKEIPNSITLADLSTKDLKRAENGVDLLMKQLYLLIEEGIYHVDLHPGNVLVDDNDNVFVIDFDKACRWTGSKNDLRDLYLHRWRRAVIKHNLPETLSEIACLHLRYNFEKNIL